MSRNAFLMLALAAAVLASAVAICGVPDEASAEAAASEPYGPAPGPRDGQGPEPRGPGMPPMAEPKRFVIDAPDRPEGGPDRIIDDYGRMFEEKRHLEDQGAEVFVFDPVLERDAGRELAGAINAVFDGAVVSERPADSEPSPLQLPESYDISFLEEMLEQVEDDTMLAQLLSVMISQYTASGSGSGSLAPSNGREDEVPDVPDEVVEEDDSEEPVLFVEDVPEHIPSSVEYITVHGFDGGTFFRAPIGPLGSLVTTAPYRHHSSSATALTVFFHQKRNRSEEDRGEEDTMSIFDSIFEAADSVGPEGFLLSVVTALASGMILSGLYIFRNRHTDSYAVAVAVLPPIVAAVIMAVSGDIGAGIAVAGAFSLVRFRSAPGSAKEMAVLFLAMASGLLCGMGLVTYALLFSVLVGLIIFALTSVNYGGTKKNEADRIVRITIPEDLDYNSEIESVLDEYTSRYELTSVRSVNMGSMFKLTYKATLSDVSRQKEMIDKVRVRNGNLEVAVLREEAEAHGL